MKTSDKILQMLKTRGALTAKVIATELGLTTMAVRQHLQSLEESRDLVYEDRKATRGRPTRYWALTPKSNSHFSDRHEELTVQLIDSVKTIFGDGALEQLITHREQATYTLYSQALSNVDGLQAKLNILAKLRTEEGYMATIEQHQELYFLLENHCPICAAATSCLSFCRSELQLFQSLFTAEANITREEHIIEGARRCAYKIVPIAG
ncbi:helix-turn-helix transcriptional regulator [Shewanella fidelis]|uniref:Transcriptional regulator n=1 Tax=Shewanella fidelis TaxID=173509 RepID=A0AAW8NQ70_9GAMM|nr:metalloregulator ArsR/SmtB family transcription factor [Shewanella fidelis]MDR8524935.1 transcriptional regulator [Shewanella fidelis]MDW4811006.1 transcriptional regulator [Shewanella fidelis]MDW4815215.1 transcriptional regulator [Shewanella fidelis]MDW4819305.1 transcriptional regulator [Shewanella fidelis]MDW4823017.1 transcriptional regulator [Shewanella fidelis]